MAGMPATPENALVQKIGPLPEDFYETAVKEADITLIEADGWENAGKDSSGL